MLSEKELSDLIGQIYDCALDKSRWPATVGSICEAMGGLRAELSVLNTLSGNYDIMAVHGWPPALLEIVLANMHVNPFISLGLVMPLAEPFCVSRDYGLAEMRRTPYWSRVIKGLGTGDFVILPLKRTVANLAYLGVSVSDTRGEFSDGDIELARLLAPHIQRSIHISGLLDHRKVIEGTLQQMLETLSAAAFIVGFDGFVRYRNREAETYLADGGFVRESNNRIVGAHRAMAEFLDAAFKPENYAQRALSLYIANENSQPLQATCLRLTQDDGNGEFLLLMRSPEPELQTPLQTATKLFSLTMRETQILAQLLKGQNLQEIGDFLGVARSTVKMHLESIYSKSGTGRQSDLIRTVMSLATTVRS